MARATSELKAQDRGVALMSAQSSRAKLASWPVTCFTTVSRRTNAVWSLPRFGGARARSPRRTLASCRSGGHGSGGRSTRRAGRSLGLLPPYVADRATATSVSDMQIHDRFPARHLPTRRRPMNHGTIQTRELAEVTATVFTSCCFGTRARTRSASRRGRARRRPVRHRRHA